MNLKTRYTTNELKLFENATGIIIEDREYTNEEMDKFGHKITEYIMSRSCKNEEINQLMSQYDSILDTLIKEK